MAIEFKERLRHAKATFGWGWGVIGVVYGAAVLLLRIRDNLLDAATRAKYDTLNFIPHWPLSYWLTGFFALASIAALEGSYRVNRTVVRALAKVNEGVAKIINVNVSDFPYRGKFDLLVEIVVPEKTAFTNEWSLDIETSKGRSTGHQGWISDHQCDVGRYTMKVSFPFGPAVPDLATVMFGRIERLSGVDARGRKFSYTPVAT
jgi:hypothetical protein